MGLLAELRRRRLFRVAALYVVGAWMVLQVFDLLFPRLGVPDAVMDLAFIGAILGFPVALVFGWIYDITPQGITRTRPSGGDADYSDLSLKRPDYLILAALVFVVAAIVYGLAMEVSEIPPEGDELLATPEAPENSIAVLPFANMSSDPDNEFFCDGISEEILNNLSAIGSLHVIARTSSFALKGSGYDIRKMAAILGVRYLLQGSVRREGKQLRISTQLLDRSGQQLWNTTFDREMEGIFAIQRDIADSVAVTITPRIVTTAKSRHTPLIEAYEHYLLGHEMYVKRLPSYQWTAAEQFRKAIELDPQFAEPYAELATVLTLGARWDDDYQESLNLAQDAIDTALELDPNLARAYAAQGLLLTMQNPQDLARAKLMLQKALDLDSNLVNAHNWLAGVLGEQGHDEEATAQFEAAIRVDPLAPIINLNLSLRELDRGSAESAERRLLRLLQVPRPSHHAYGGLSTIYEQTGRLVDGNKVARQNALAFARNEGRAWVRDLAHSYARLGMWQQADDWYGYLEHHYADVYQIQFDRLFMWRRQGRFEEMEERFSHVLESRDMPPSELPPMFAMVYGTTLSMAGEFAGAIKILEQTLSFETGGEAGLGDENAYDPIQAFAWARVMTGDVSGTKKIIDLMEDVFLEKESLGLLHTSALRFNFAQNALLSGDMETALDRLQLAVDAGWRDYFLLLHDPRWASVRDNPRFSKIMASVKADIDAQGVEVELIDSEDDLLAQIDAAVAEYKTRAGTSGN
jgi:TolB-like protein/Tfp pilus assembly protein PilF